MSKFTMRLLSCLAVSRMSLFGCIEVAKIFLNVVDANARSELSSSKVNASKSCIAWLATFVAAVFFVRCISQIQPPIVSANAIDVVNLFCWINSGNHLEYKSVSRVKLGVNAYVDVTGGANALGYLSGKSRVPEIASSESRKMVSRSSVPGEIPGIWVVREALAQKLGRWQSSHSHVHPPIRVGLVRSPSYVSAFSGFAILMPIKCQ